MKPYVLVFFGMSLAFLAFGLGGWWTVVPPLVLFLLVPAADQLLALDTDNTPGSPALRYLPMVFVPAQLLLTLGGLWLILHRGFSGWEQGMLILDLGFASALGINVAHELMHRPGKVDQRLAELLMASVTYTHFCVEHVQGHHKNVATERDPATSRKGESLYAYLPRTIWGGLWSAWGIEKARSGSGWGNRLVRYAVAQVAVFAGLWAWLGPWGVLAFLAQSLVAIVMLETINYIEHYGLQRAEIAPGKPERVAPRHSWNSSHRLTNWMLLNLSRHSDHHAFAARPFTELRHYDEVPQLPASYSAMMLLATVPPLWFRVMDRRVDAWVSPHG